MLNNQSHCPKAGLRSYLCGFTIPESHFIGLSLSLNCIYTGGHFSHSHWDLQHAGILKDCFIGIELKDIVLLTA